jgi:hypothetical protein
MHVGQINGTPIFFQPADAAAWPNARGQTMGAAYGFAFDEKGGPVPPAPVNQPEVPSKFDQNVPVGATIQITFGPWSQPGGTFADVPPTSPFFTWIEALFKAGITGGCQAMPLLYCPDQEVTRAQMAVFLLRGIHGAAYQPPAATGTMFADVPSGLALADWIEELAREGITSGCATSPPQYCPNASVTRAQMAVFLLRALHGAGYIPPPATGTVFADVPASDPFAPWIEQLAAEGITGGCGGGNYCPNQAVTRAEMAVFLVRTFNLPM